jgi:O-antigen/teichoic acid export membrane protein
LLSGLLDTLYQDLQGLVIGKKYDSATLGFYNRGKQFPQFLMNSINGTVQSVMLPAMSKQQDKKDELKAMMRNSITVSAYIVFPLMAGLAGVAEPLIKLLLTDKWLPCVPYLQIFCFSAAFYPVHSCNLQAINAMGRSDIFLKLEIIKKSYGLVALIIAVVFFESPMAIALTGVVTTGISCFVNAAPNKKLIDYSYFEQMKDILPSFVLSAVMFICVLFVGKIGLAPIIILAVQLIVGVIVYVGVSAVLKMSPFMQLVGVLKSVKEKK